MKKLFLALMFLLITVSVSFAAPDKYDVVKWTVAWSAIGTSTSGSSPSSYTDSGGNTWSQGVYIRSAARLYLECSTDSGSGTSTDFNFAYNNNDFSLWTLKTTITNNKTYGEELQVWGDFLILTADNNDGSNTITPSCVVSVYYEK